MSTTQVHLSNLTHMLGTRILSPTKELIFGMVALGSVHVTETIWRPSTYGWLKNMISAYLPETNKTG
jgi:hypothetical protein